MEIIIKNNEFFFFLVLEALYSLNKLLKSINTILWIFFNQIHRRQIEEREEENKFHRFRLRDHFNHHGHHYDHGHFYFIFEYEDEKSFIDLILYKWKIGKQALELMQIKHDESSSNEDQEKKIKKQHASKIKEEIKKKYKDIVLS